MNDVKQLYDEKYKLLCELRLLKLSEYFPIVAKRITFVPDKFRLQYGRQLRE